MKISMDLVGKRFPDICTDCSRTAPYYMVYNHVWVEAVSLEERRKEKQNGGMFLCFECLSRRLKRALTLDDFPPSLPVNCDVIPIVRYFTSKEYRDGQSQTQETEES